MHGFIGNFFLILKKYSIVWMDQFIQPSAEGHCCHFQVLAIVGKAATNICVQVCVWT
jgi:hypothetical protein